MNVDVVRRRTVRWLLAPLLVLVMLLLVGGSARAGDGGDDDPLPDTKVKLKVSINDRTGKAVYKVKIRKPKNCRKGRKVIVFHDENGNGKLDKGEFVIAKGKTNKRGKFKARSDALPPDGDDAAVIVKGSKRCGSGSKSVTIDADEL